MALMIPENVQDFKTDGERNFYRFLEEVAKPHDQYLVWYSPDIDELEPDFVLYHRTVGLVIFEVKDWALEQIVDANQHAFTIIQDGKISSRTNPLHQARNYRSQLMDKLTRDGRLLSKLPGYAGKVGIPISCGVVFTNINKFSYVEKGFDRVIPTDKIFFWDDLHPQSDLCADPSGRTFADRLQQMFTLLFPFSLTGKELDHLKQLIFPSVRIQLPDRGKGAYPATASRLKALDQHQEAIARKFEDGHRILSGPSGCGKTLILIHKAAFLRRYHPGRILLVCFNITLVNYLRRLLSAKGLPIGEGGIQVAHIYQLCTDILGEEIAYEKAGGDYYRMIIQMTLEALEKADPRYDAILVDEGQDFSPDMFRILTRLLNPKTNNLTIAMDENQNLYCHDFCWSDVGVAARGRIQKLSSVYRSTRQISRFAADFIRASAPAEGSGAPEQRPLFPDFFDFTGPLPELLPFRDFPGICAHVADRIAELAGTDECPFSEMAVLYATKGASGDGAKPVPDLVEAALSARGIFSTWVSRDYQSKKSYDITTNSVAISTIHSAKGLDYACVFLIGLDAFEEGKPSAEQLERLAYVGITRARYRLFIPYIRKTPVIEKLLALARPS